MKWIWKVAIGVALVVSAGCGPKPAPPPPVTPEAAEPSLTTQEKLDLAADLMRSGRIGEAADRYREIVADSARSFEANLNLGIALWSMQQAAYENERDYSQAATYLKRALEIKAGDARPYLYLGRIEFEKKSFEAAVGHLSKAASLDPGDETPHEFLGLALLETGKEDAGARELEAALAIDPEAEAPNMALGRIYERENRNQLAMAHLEKALAANPNLDMATYLLERVYYEEGMYARAEKACRRFLKYHQEDIQSLEILAWIFKIQERTAEMLDVYQKLAGIDPENTLYWSPLIQHYMETGEYSSAKRILEEALKHNPYYAYGNVRYAQVLIHLADEARAAGRRAEEARLLSLAGDHLTRAKVDDRYRDAAGQLMAQVENRLADLKHR